LFIYIIDERVDYKRTLDLFCPRILAYLSEHRTFLPYELRDSDILVIISGHKSHLNFAAAFIFLLNGIDVILLPAHSSQLKSVEKNLRLANPLRRIVCSDAVPIRI
jgi:hypothetical protein